MATFSQKMNLKYGKHGEETFEDIVKTYEWIIRSAKKLTGTIKKINAGFQFDRGSINCVTNSIEEFKEYAYGVTDFKITSFHVFIFFEDDKEIMCTYINSFSVKAEDIVLLQEYVKALEDTEVDEQPEFINNGTINNYNFNGNQNTVIGDNSSNNTVSNTVEVKSDDKKESKLKEFFKNVFYNISSNVIWYILSAIGVGIVGFLTYYFLHK